MQKQLIKKSLDNEGDSADLLEVEVEEAVHDGVGDDRGHGEQVAHREQHQQLLATFGAGLL